MEGYKTLSRRKVLVVRSVLRLLLYINKQAEKKSDL